MGRLRCWEDLEERILFNGFLSPHVLVESMRSIVEYLPESPAFVSSVSFPMGLRMSPLRTLRSSAEYTQSWVIEAQSASTGCTDAMQNKAVRLTASGTVSTASLWASTSPTTWRRTSANSNVPKALSCCSFLSRQCHTSPSSGKRRWALCIQGRSMLSLAKTRCV